jgi:hypothetical protein
MYYLCMELIRVAGSNKKTMKSRIRPTQENNKVQIHNNTYSCNKIYMIWPFRCRKERKSTLLDHHVVSALTEALLCDHPRSLPVKK